MVSGLFIGGCSYAVKPAPSPAVNIYSSYDEKIPGTWVIVPYENISSIHKEIKTGTSVCIASKYSVNVGDTIDNSIKRTMRSIFENIVEHTSMPTNIGLKNLEANGSILVSLDTFEPKIRCSTFGGVCSGSSDIKLGVVVRGKSGKLFATSVEDSAIVDSDSATTVDRPTQGCSRLAYLISEAISKNIKSALEKMGERLSNSPKLREI